MPFVARTGLYRVSTGALLKGWNRAVRTPQEVWNDLTAGQRTLVTGGDAELRWELACYYRVRLVGRERTRGHLVIEYDVWRTRADYDAGQPPVWRNTHAFQVAPGMFADMTGAEKRQWLRRHIEAAITRAGLRPRGGDERDRRLQADPWGVEQDADLGAIDGADAELT